MAARVWHEEIWPAIRAKAEAEAENAAVLFGDHVGVRSDRVTVRTWGAKGATPVVRRTGNRFSVNAMSVMTPTTPISARGRVGSQRAVRPDGVAAVYERNQSQRLRQYCGCV